MEKKDNVEKGVSGKPEEKKSAAYYEKRPEFGNRGPSKILLHFRKGITFFLVIAACVIFYFLLLRIEDISVGVSKVIDVLKPILYGMVIAYLLNPIVKQIDRWLIPQLKKKMSQEKAKKVSRSVGVFAALVMLLALILALCNMLIPELYKSIRDMVRTLPGQISDMVTKIISIQKDTSPAGVMARNLLEKGSDALQNWIKQDLLTKVNEVMSNLTVGIINFVSEILNFLIGLIVSVYILFSKETFSEQSKKIVYAVLRTDHANMILHLTKKSNEIFGGFIIGKIIDSAIIGVLCFFGLYFSNTAAEIRFFRFLSALKTTFFTWMDSALWFSSGSLSSQKFPFRENLPKSSRLSMFPSFSTASIPSSTMLRLLYASPLDRLYLVARYSTNALVSSVSHDNSCTRTFVSLSPVNVSAKRVVL